MLHKLILCLILAYSGSISADDWEEPNKAVISIITLCGTPLIILAEITEDGNSSAQWDTAGDVYNGNVESPEFYSHVFDEAYKRKAVFQYEVDLETIKSVWGLPCPNPV